MSLHHDNYHGKLTTGSVPKLAFEILISTKTFSKCVFKIEIGKTYL